MEIGKTFFSKLQARCVMSLSLCVAGRWVSKWNSSLDNEVDLEVFESIAYVDSPEFFWVKLVVKLIAGPLERTNHHALAALVHLKRPASSRLVQICRLKESRIEGCSRKVKLRPFGLILHVTEMQVIFKTHAFFAGESSECLIAAHLVLRSHLKGSNRAHLTIVLNRVNSRCQSVKLYISTSNAQKLASQGLKHIGKFPMLYQKQIANLPVRGLVGTLTSSSDVSSSFFSLPPSGWDP